MTAPAPPRPRATTQQPLCASYIGARVVRVTRLDRCGKPVYGPKSQVVSKGFVKAEIGFESEDGEDYTTKNADGSACITGSGPTIIKWATIQLEFCQVDPDILAIMNPTWEPVIDYHGRSSGVEIGRDLSSDVGFALEMWPKAANAGEACLTGDTNSGDFAVNGYVLMPWCLGTAPESIPFEDAAVTFTMNAKTNPGALWGRGPYNVTHNEQGMPAPLPRPFDPGFDVPKWNFQTTGNPKHIWLDIVDLLPPKPSCGAKPLWNPDAVAPTVTATATSGNTMSVDFSVTNWSEMTPQAGTIDWGDGNSQPLNANSGGTATHEYASSTAGQKQTITFTPGNGHEPVTVDFTPQQATSQAATLTRSPVEGDVDPHTIRLTLDDPPTGEFAVDWGDGAIDNVTGAGPHRHTYQQDGTYRVVTTDESGREVTRDQVTVPTSSKKGKK